MPDTSNSNPCSLFIIPSTAKSLSTAKTKLASLNVVKKHKNEGINDEKPTYIGKQQSISGKVVS